MKTKTEKAILYRLLTDEEKQDFREWARVNYHAFEPIEGIWHPIVQRECVRMNEEKGLPNAEPY